MTVDKGLILASPYLLNNRKSEHLMHVLLDKNIDMTCTATHYRQRMQPMWLFSFILISLRLASKGDESVPPAGEWLEK